MTNYANCLVSWLDQDSYSALLHSYPLIQHCFWQRWTLSLDQQIKDKYRFKLINIESDTWTLNFSICLIYLTSSWSFVLFISISDLSTYLFYHTFMGQYQSNKKDLFWVLNIKHEIYSLFLRNKSFVIWQIFYIILSNFCR